MKFATNDASMTSNGKFEIGAKCLALFGTPQLMYEAKILSGPEMRDQELHYLIHYVGWKSRWDEWKSISDMFEILPENLERKAALEIEAKSKSHSNKSSKKRVKTEDSYVKAKRLKISSKADIETSNRSAKRTINSKYDVDSKLPENVSKVEGSDKKECLGEVFKNSNHIDVTKTSNNSSNKSQTSASLLTETPQNNICNSAVPEDCKQLSTESSNFSLAVHSENKIDISLKEPNELESDEILKKEVNELSESIDNSTEISNKSDNLNKLDVAPIVVKKESETSKETSKIKSLHLTKLKEKNIVNKPVKEENLAKKPEKVLTDPKDCKFLLAIGGTIDVTKRKKKKDKKETKDTIKPKPVIPKESVTISPMINTVIEDQVVSNSPEKTRYVPYIVLTTSLNRILQEDQVLICEKLQLLKLPAVFTISFIIKDYLRSMKPIDTEQLEVMKYLVDYFIIMLRARLFYEEELDQFNKLNCTDETLVDVYGMVHLCRMLLKFEGVLRDADFPSEHFKDLVRHLKPFIQYLDMNSSRFYNQTRDYVSSTI